MAVRRFSMELIAAAALACFVMVSPAFAQAQNSDATLAAQVRRAERILIATPEKDTDVAAGEQFLVEIDEVLRGTGVKGRLARIQNSGDKQKHPRYKAGRRYVFLLTKNLDSAGWVNLGTSEIPIEDDKVRFLVDGKAQETVSLADFEALVAGVEPARESLVGKWILVMSQQGNDFHIWLVDIVRDAKGVFKASLVETAPNMMAASTLKDAQITGREVRLVLLADGEAFDFRGRLDNGTVRGSIAVAGRMLAPARMLATDAGSLKKNAEPAPSAGRSDFLEAAGAEMPFDALLKFVGAHGESPLAIEAYGALVMLSPSQDLKPDQFRKLADDYQRAASNWGSRFELKALIDLGVSLSRADYLPQLALEYLNAAGKKLTDESPESWKLLVHAETGKRLLLGARPAEGLALLRKLHSAHPFDEQITWHLARYAQQEKDSDAAIRLYGEIVATPMAERDLALSLSQGNKKITRDELPSRVLERLWIARNGDKKGLPEFLSQTYERSLQDLAVPKSAPRKEGQGTRVVLCELFTGSACPPCIGADAAAAALEATFGKSEVVVLRYHQHIPAPDPLANDDGEERFSSYDGEGTPALYVNGKSFAGPGGSMTQVPDIYRRLRETVEPYLTEKTGLQLELTARAEQGRVAVSAKAAGLKSFPAEVHLKLALAEDKVAYLAMNGIRVHEMIVRAMPGGADGIEPVKGQLAWRGEIDLSKLRTDLNQSLSKIEREAKFEFDQKPFEFKTLHLVAFLQHDGTGEVLQAAAIPVAGTPTHAGETPRPAPGKTARSKAPVAGPN